MVHSYLLSYSMNLKNGSKHVSIYGNRVFPWYRNKSNNNPNPNPFLGLGLFFNFIARPPVPSPTSNFRGLPSALLPSKTKYRTPQPRGSRVVITCRRKRDSLTKDRSMPKRRAVYIEEDGMSRTIVENTRKISPMDVPPPNSPHKRGLRILEEGIVLPNGHDYNKRRRLY